MDKAYVEDSGGWVPAVVEGNSLVMRMSEPVSYEVAYALLNKQRIPGDPLPKELALEDEYGELHRVIILSVTETQPSELFCYASLGKKSGCILGSIMWWIFGTH